MFAGHISLFKFAKTSSASAASSLQQVVLLPLYFGCRWAAYWCSRLGGLRVRLLHQFRQDQGLLLLCVACEAGWARVALVSQAPLQSFAFGTTSSRYCAGLLELRDNDVIRRLVVASYYTGSSDSTQTRDLLAGLFDEVFLASDDFAVMDDCRALQDGASPADGAPGRSTLDFVPVVSTPCRDQHHSWDR